MANKKIENLIIAGSVSDTMQYETDIGGTTANKVTSVQIKTYTNNGTTGGRTLTGGTAASENMILDSTSDVTKGQVQLANGTLLHTNTTNYETLVLDDDDIPNKKYVDDKVEGENIWDRAATNVTLHNAGDTIQFDSSGGIQFGGAGQNIIEFSVDVNLADNLDTKISTQKAVKTYIDNHSVNGAWTRTGTTIAPTNAGDLLDMKTGTFKFTTGATISEISIDGTLGGNSDTAVPTEKSTKTYVDNHTTNGVWQRIGTVISPVNAGDDVNSGTGNVITTKLVSTEIEFAGNITVDAINAAANSTINLTNSDATFNANVAINGTGAISEISDDATLASDSVNAIITEHAAKTYIDAHTGNGMWTRTGTDIGVTTAGDNLKLDTAGVMIQSVSSVFDVVAATGITPITDMIVVVQSSTAGDTNITANPQIAAGTVGQRLTLIGNDDTKTVTLDDGAGLALNNGQSFTLGQNDTIDFVFYNSLWLEKTRSNN